MKLERLFAAQSEFFIGFRELTRAIQLVALAKLASLSIKIKSRQRTLAVLHRLFAEGTAKERTRKYLVIVIGTDKTCCGALNTNLFSATRELVTRLEKGGRSLELIPFGEKARLFVKREYKRYWRQSFLRIDRETPSLALSAIILEEIFLVHFWEKIDKYIVIYNRYYNMKVQRVTGYILPTTDVLKKFFLTPWARLWKTNKFFALFLRRKAARSRVAGLRFLNNLWFFAASLVLLDALEEHRYSESGARATTMENACSNLQDMIDDLRINYNQVRQDAITTDLIEIVSGMLFSRTN